VIPLFVPGRLCLFGEHSDWAGGHRATHPALAPGFCLVMGTDQGLRAEARPLDAAFEISSRLPDGSLAGPARFPLEPDTLDEAARGGGFFRYAAGVAAEVVLRFPRVGGVSLAITAADLPVQKGLSSSAAACVLVARAFSRAHALDLSAREEMNLAYAGERRAGSECGRMDQICALGRAPSFLTFDGDRLEIETLAPAAPIYLLVVDLRRAKDTRRILADLNRCFPDTPGPLAAGVRAALGPRNAELLARARDAVEKGDPRALGALMREAQDLFDRRIAPACPELAAPKLHEVLAHPAVAELAWGGKGVGSQGDGCAQLVCRGPAEREALARRLTRDLEVTCLPQTLAPER
jgi:galactokinase